MNLKHTHHCRVCGNPHLAPVIDLGDQYLQGSFVKPGQAQPTERKIPTKLVRCDVTKRENACGAVQMSVTTSPTVLYHSYWYRSGVSQTMRDHLKEVVDQVVALVNPKTVLDIAANDLTLLSYYTPEVRKVAIDPSDILRRSTLANTHAINDCFPTAKLTPDYLFDAITTIAMFYDIDDPVAFVQRVNSHLTPEGIWVVEVAYLPATLKQVSYDTIVHEHLLYYSLASLEHVLKAAGMRAFKAEINDVNGGSIKLFTCKEGCFKYDTAEANEALNKLRVDEFSLALDTDEPYETFRAKVRVQRDTLIKIIGDINETGGKVFLYGASTKMNTLLQYCQLDYTSIPYAAERSEEKWGAKTLGTNIPIISEADARAMKPTHFLVGPWHFRDEILKREAETIRSGVKFIMPLPTVEVISHVP
jgi:C-methyltransferase-like protein/putative zinc binding protein/methyltransferase family protein